MVSREVISAERRRATSAIETPSARGASCWPISYTSIEAIVCVLDILLIVATSVVSGTIYGSLFHKNEIDRVRQIATNSE